MSILKAAGLIALVSLFSKFIGLFRDIVFAHYCGLSAVADAYNTAYLLPGSFALLMIGGLNGPFHSAVVAALSQPYEQKDFKTYRGVLVTTVICTVLILGGLTLAGIQWAPTIIRLIGSKLPPPYCCDGRYPTANYVSDVCIGWFNWYFLWRFEHSQVLFHSQL